MLLDNSHDATHGASIAHRLRPLHHTDSSRHDQPTPNNSHLAREGMRCPCSFAMSTELVNGIKGKGNFSMSASRALAKPHSHGDEPEVQ